MSPKVRLFIVTLAAPVLALVVAAPAHSSTDDSDPLFGDGCRYVTAETPTSEDPEVELCRPW